MKAPLSAGQLAVALLSLTPAVSALAWPRWLPELDSLVVRQDDGSSTDTPSATPTPSPNPSDNTNTGNNKGDSTDEQQTTTTGKNNEPQQTNLNTGGIKQTGSHTATMTGNRTTTHRSKHTMFDPQAPPGGVVMVTPAVTDGLALYKIGSKVTWGWNYTNVQGTPTGIDIYVKCSKVPQPWTVTQNMTYTKTGNYTWDTKQFQTDNVANPLLTEMYTLVIADADTGISATPEPGYLAPYSGFSFGLYEPQEYHDNGDGYQCASCSGAMSSLDPRAVSVAVMMSTVTVLSFTWFVAGFGAF
ncbi:uncharacterized protein C8A04DRAFT_9923 [Dichotomopilus funicola]|uniref:DUF7137 domain-containing protein n=1 Tax=Dichotomopilus funicola TaxID=1934379 RepID=A0AAN6V9B6_9PEZI|nr:hypothetical protein C8A04DRAFT_9923 [Dichotomopilus funicola]